jgi:2-hydroxy-3-keto-5-methylthiopentenyl-1-phosphate phosphatase
LIEGHVRSKEVVEGLIEGHIRSKEVVEGLIEGHIRSKEMVEELMEGHARSKEMVEWLIKGQARSKEMVEWLIEGHVDFIVVRSDRKVVIVIVIEGSMKRGKLSDVPKIRRKRRMKELVAANVGRGFKMTDVNDVGYTCRDCRRI